MVMSFQHPSGTNGNNIAALIKNIYSILIISFICSLFGSILYPNTILALAASNLPAPYVDLEGTWQDIPLAIPVEGGKSLPMDSLGTGSQNFSQIQSDNESDVLVHTKNDVLTSFATCDKIPITSVSASGNDGNVSSNVIDGVVKEENAEEQMIRY